MVWRFSQRDKGSKCCSILRNGTSVLKKYSINSQIHHSDSLLQSLIYDSSESEEIFVLPAVVQRVMSVVSWNLWLHYGELP